MSCSSYSTTSTLSDTPNLKLHDESLKHNALEETQINTLQEYHSILPSTGALRTAPGNSSSAIPVGIWTCTSGKFLPSLKLGSLTSHPGPAAGKRSQQEQGEVRTVFILNSRNPLFQTLQAITSALACLSFRDPETTIQCKSYRWSAWCYLMQSFRDCPAALRCGLRAQKKGGNGSTGHIFFLGSRTKYTNSEPTPRAYHPLTDLKS